jgi:L-glyceraldehyde 3-phosphate reductase
MTYSAADKRYDSMRYNRCGQSGLLLPVFSLGLWHNFGDDASPESIRELALGAFDLGITHFDLANNYGPPPGSAERRFGEVLKGDLKAYRDELIISTKAGYLMWPGPYGRNGSRKHLLASLDQSLSRMGLDYVDIFYSHKFDPDTPLEETMGALHHAVQQGKALYAGISSYSAKKTREAVTILRDLGTPCLIHQPSYSMFNRWIEQDLLGAIEDEGIGCIAFSPLAQGMLTDKYLGQVPENSRAGRNAPSFRDGFLNEESLKRIQGLSTIAQSRGQSLAQMALAWCLRQPQITTLLIGASRLEQLKENIGALDNLSFTDEELAAIDVHAVDGGINIWEASSTAG